MFARPVVSSRTAPLQSIRYLRAYRSCRGSIRVLVNAARCASAGPCRIAYPSHGQVVSQLRLLRFLDLCPQNATAFATSHMLHLRAQHHRSAQRTFPMLSHCAKTSQQKRRQMTQRLSIPCGAMVMRAAVYRDDNGSDYGRCGYRKRRTSLRLGQTGGLPAILNMTDIQRDRNHALTLYKEVL